MARVHPKQVDGCICVAVAVAGVLAIEVLQMGLDRRLILLALDAVAVGSAEPLAVEPLDAGLALVDVGEDDALGGRASLDLRSRGHVGRRMAVDRAEWNRGQGG